MRRLLSHLSYANVVATLALVLAVTGGAYAASQLPKNSVGSKQVKDSSLKAKDFKPGQLPTGTTGPQGPQGRDGAPGPTLTVTGSKSAPGSIVPTGCPSWSLESDSFSVTRPTVLEGHGALGYQALGAAAPYSHGSTLQVILFDAAHSYAAQVLQDRGPTNNEWLSANGVFRASDGSAYVLQPGTTYTVQLYLSVTSGSCGQGTSAVLDPAVDWIGFPAPS